MVPQYLDVVVPMLILMQLVYIDPLRMWMAYFAVGEELYFIPNPFRSCFVHIYMVTPVVLNIWSNVLPLWPIWCPFSSWIYIFVHYHFASWGYKVFLLEYNVPSSDVYAGILGLRL